MRKLNLQTTPHLKSQAGSLRRAFYFKLFLVICFSIILGILVAVYFFDFGKIKKVNVQIPADLVCASTSQIEQLSRIKGKNIFNLNGESIKKGILDKYPCISRVSLKTKLPGSAEIIAESRKAAIQLEVYKPNEAEMFATAPVATGSATLKFPEKSGFTESYVADEDGFVFAKKDDRLAAPVTLELYGGDVRVGNKVEEDKVKKFADILGRLVPMGVSVSRAALIEEKLLLQSYLHNETDNNAILAFSLGKDTARQLASLQLILQKAKMNSAEPFSERGVVPDKKGSGTPVIVSVDLRFDKPVVVYSK